MASPFSKPIEYAPYVDQVDKDLLVKAVTYKQGKFDLNRSRLQAQLNAASQIPLDKKQDREYFNERMTALVNTINLHGAGDISADTRADYISGYIAEAADDKVANGYASTMYKRNYDAEWAKISEDDPDKFNQDNYNYGLQNYTKWLNDGQVGSSVNDYYDPRIGKGVGRANPFVNVDAAIRENLKEIDPRITFQLTPFGNGIQYFNEKREVITDEQVLNDINLTLSGDPKLKTQLGINAWAQYGNASSDDLLPIIQNDYATKISNIDKNIFALQQSSAGATDEQKSIITANLEQLNSAKRELEQASTPEAIARTLSDPNSRISTEFNLYTNNLLGGYVERYAKDEIVSRTGFTDEVAKARFNSALRMSEARYKASLDATNELSNRQFNLLKEMTVATATGDFEKAKGLASVFDITGMGTGLASQGGRELTGMELLQQQTMLNTYELDQPLDPESDADAELIKNINQAAYLSQSINKDLAYLNGYDLNTLSTWTSDQFTEEANRVGISGDTKQRLLEAAAAAEAKEEGLGVMQTLSDNVKMDWLATLKNNGYVSFQDAGIFDIAGQTVTYNDATGRGNIKDVFTSASMDSELRWTSRLIREKDRARDVAEGYNILGMSFDNSFTRWWDGTMNDLYYSLGDFAGFWQGQTIGRVENLISEGHLGYTNTVRERRVDRYLAKYGAEGVEALDEFAAARGGTVTLEGELIDAADIIERTRLREIAEGRETGEVSITKTLEDDIDANSLDDFLNQVIDRSSVSIPGASYGVNADGDYETNPDLIVGYSDKYIDVNGVTGVAMRQAARDYADAMGIQEPQLKMVSLNTVAQAYLLDDALVALERMPDVDGEDVRSSLPPELRGAEAWRKHLESSSEDRRNINANIKNLGDELGSQILSYSIDGGKEVKVVINPVEGTSLYNLATESYQSQVIRNNINYKNAANFNQARLIGTSGPAGTQADPVYKIPMPSAEAYDPSTGLIIQPKLSMEYVASPDADRRGAEGYPGQKALKLDAIKFYDANTSQYLGEINSLNGSQFGNLMDSRRNGAEIYGSYDRTLSNNTQQVLLTDENIKAFTEEFRKQQGE